MAALASFRPMAADASCSGVVIACCRKASMSAIMAKSAIGYSPRFDRIPALGSQIGQISSGFELLECRDSMRDQRSRRGRANAGDGDEIIRLGLLFGRFFRSDFISGWLTHFVLSLGLGLDISLGDSIRLIHFHVPPGLNLNPDQLAFLCPHLLIVDGPVLRIFDNGHISPFYP